LSQNIPNGICRHRHDQSVFNFVQEGAELIHSMKYVVEKKFKKGAQAKSLSLFAQWIKKRSLKGSFMVDVWQNSKISKLIYENTLICGKCYILDEAAHGMLFAHNNRNKQHTTHTHTHKYRQIQNNNNNTDTRTRKIINKNTQTSSRVG
jgi:hypothetical protein